MNWNRNFSKVDHPRLFTKHVNKPYLQVIHWLITMSLPFLEVLVSQCIYVCQLQTNVASEHV